MDEKEGKRGGGGEKTETYDHNTQDSWEMEEPNSVMCLRKLRQTKITGSTPNDIYTENPLQLGREMDL